MSERTTFIVELQCGMVFLKEPSNQEFFLAIDYEKLVHSGIQTLTPYIPGKSIDELAQEQGITNIIKLASNENPWGCSPLVHDILCNESQQYRTLYPSAILHPVRKKISEHLGVDNDQVMLSNGSDFIYTLLLILFALNTDKHILTHQYAFQTYQVQAQTLGIPFHVIPVHPNWEVNIEALMAACTTNTALIFMANPNNPTGLLIEKEKIKQLLSGLSPSTILVLDEAYYEFAYPKGDPGCLNLLNEHDNLVITRTFSKAYGLAGLRLGYAIAHPSIIRLLHRIQLPFTVNQAAMNAGIAALRDQAFLAHTLQYNKLGLVQMQHGLQQLGLVCKPSACNFITFDCGSNSAYVYQKLLQQGIIVRPLNAYNLPNHLRISIGKPEQNARFLDILQRFPPIKNLQYFSGF